jgi:transposase-like protein
MEVDSNSRSYTQEAINDIIREKIGMFFTKPKIEEFLNYKLTEAGTNAITLAMTKVMIGEYSKLKSSTAWNNKLAVIIADEIDNIFHKKIEQSINKYLDEIDFENIIKNFMKDAIINILNKSLPYKYNSINRKNVLFTCENCGKKFESKNASAPSRRKFRVRFCSLACRKQNNSPTLLGKINKKGKT